MESLSAWNPKLMENAARSGEAACSDDDTDEDHLVIVSKRRLRNCRPSPNEPIHGGHRFESQRGHTAPRGNMPSRGVIRDPQRGISRPSARPIPAASGGWLLNPCASATGRRFAFPKGADCPKEACRGTARPLPHLHAMTRPSHGWRADAEARTPTPPAGW